MTDIATVLSLVPLPASVQASTAAPFVLDDSVVVSGDADAAAELHRLVLSRTGVRLRPVGAAAAASSGSASVIDLAVDGAGPAESYRLDVATDAVRLRAADAAGLFYAAHTFVQLIVGHAGGGMVPAVSVDDAPRFAYRGVMLDVARHFFSPAVVHAYIDRAAALKFNHLHLHLSDDQGWRLELKSRPALTERASATSVGGGPGGFYTREDYLGIVAHAARRHMTVVPEFDMPGHTHAVGLAYPELAVDPVLEVAGDEPYTGSRVAEPIAGEPYTGTRVGFSSLRTTDDATLDFVEDVFAELASLTPGPYLHFGGDESRSTDAAEFAAFVARVSRIVQAQGKTPIAWHEAGAAGDLAPGTIGQYWGVVTPTDGADDHARAFVERGGRVILSPADAVYLDMKPDASAALGLTWANGPTSVERAYRWEPADIVPGIGEADILGVEAPLWTETVQTLDDIDALAFPRIAAAAEAAWSPATGTRPLRTWESFRARVGGLGPLWTTLGIRFPASPEIPWHS